MKGLEALKQGGRRKEGGGKKIKWSEPKRDFCTVAKGVHFYQSMRGGKGLRRH